MLWSDRVSVAEAAGLLQAHRNPRMRTTDFNKPSALNPVSTPPAWPLLGSLAPLVRSSKMKTGKFQQQVSQRWIGQGAGGELAQASRWPSSERAFRRVAAHVSCVRCLSVVPHRRSEVRQRIRSIERQDGVELFGELRHIAFVPRSD
ncbi:hypothetical protein [Rhizobium sp. BT-175]|uniref:hypothetical protein n=1 Tax=Rhizobium sp. BT-175 TaxID=2986929 RepID=UPI002236A25E|nr:hypothetical protein [Rhizobium sp. BT-175]MCV9945189.1 hypothetical protein [Rhizobium sp. BT-175]